ncbi:sulfur transferase domain-containing protein [Acinetobacter sp. B51(2017)]|uniref:beta-lactamase hydrolase domain-containing protein n=1 Tax=Acinetobacter sp. B51(2017) TaxID=2060938 RepID=UPI000F08DAA0|nr:sulfur transferase domain-containing protein [Acinetobacter sp. B51(2017)]
MTKHFFATVIAALFLSMSSPSFAQSQTTALSKSLSATVSVTGQMSTDKFKHLMQQGFKSVIVNRPDQEPGNLVSVNQLRSIAEQAKVSVIYQPVVSGKISQTDVAEFAKYYNELPKPILMVCRSGTRSKALFDQAKAQGLLHE